MNGYDEVQLRCLITGAVEAGVRAALRPEKPHAPETPPVPAPWIVTFSPGFTAEIGQDGLLFQRGSESFHVAREHVFALKRLLILHA